MNTKEPIKVMIVDDHLMVRDGLKVFLSVHDDLEVIAEAEDGQQAISLCPLVHPDVILMDVIMPNIDGPTATARIRADYPDVQVIALTTFSEKELVQRAIQAGAVVLGSGTVAAVVAGYVPALMFVGLFLLGLGWNIGLIGGTTLLTASVPQHARVEAQGTGDLTLSLCGAVAALGSGFVKQSAGFHVLADAATVLAALLLGYAWVTQARLARAGKVAAA